MTIADEWDLLAALPYLAAFFGVFAVAAMGFGGSLLRLGRSRRRMTERRDPSGPAPWAEWLREINEKAERDRLDH